MTRRCTNSVSVSCTPRNHTAIMLPNEHFFSPIVTDDGSVASEILMWNGRLDNRNELLWSLSAASGEREDSALVLAAFDRWGISGLGRLIGDWSVVIHDKRRQAIVLASDFAGVRPLYYRHGERTIRWSSRLE